VVQILYLNDNKQNLKIKIYGMGYLILAGAIMLLTG
jgi:hypothetical protein